MGSAVYRDLRACVASRGYDRSAISDRVHMQDTDCRIPGVGTGKLGKSVRKTSRRTVYPSDGPTSGLSAEVDTKQYISSVSITESMIRRHASMPASANDCQAIAATPSVDDGGGNAPAVVWSGKLETVVASKTTLYRP